MYFVFIMEVELNVNLGKMHRVSLILKDSKVCMKKMQGYTAASLRIYAYILQI